MSDTSYNSATFIQQGIHNTTWSGAFTSPQSAPVIWTKMGNIVHLYFSAASDTAGSATTIQMDTALPAIIRPTREYQINLGVVDIGARTTGMIDLTSGGEIVFYATAALGNFTIATTIGFQFSSVTYSLI